MKAKQLAIKSARALLSAAFWILVWYLCARRVASELILPSPFQTFERLLELLGTSEFYIISFKSILHILLGALCGLLAGVIAAVLSSSVKFIDELLKPLVTVVRATPVASFIVIAVLWLGRGVLPAFISALMVFPIIFLNVKTGIENVSKEKRKLIKIFNVSFFDSLKKIYLPSVLPYFFSAAITSLGLAWKAGIAAEVLAFTPDSIGRKVSESKNLLETTDLFAWTATIIIISLIIEFIFKKLISLLSKKYGNRGAKQCLKSKISPKSMALLSYMKI